VRVLLVEDSDRVAAVMASGLREAGHVVTVAGDCAAARERLDAAELELAIVDVGLPDGSGLELCRQARRAGHDLPILVVTARNGVDERVAGLDAGADDYLGKPFAMKELLARVRALGRRGPRWVESTRVFGEIVVDRERRTLTRRGVPVALTARELDIVALLAWRDGRVVPREEILEAVWGDATERAAASLEVLLARIRRKLGEGALRTVRNVGYAWALERSKRA
jgi:two-component system OmpR family response regulator